MEKLKNRLKRLQTNAGKVPTIEAVAIMTLCGELLDAVDDFKTEEKKLLDNIAAQEKKFQDSKDALKNPSDMYSYLKILGAFLDDNFKSDVSLLSLNDLLRKANMSISEQADFNTDNMVYKISIPSMARY